MLRIKQRKLTHILTSVRRDKKQLVAIPPYDASKSGTTMLIMQQHDRAPKCILFDLQQQQQQRQQTLHYYYAVCYVITRNHCLTGTVIK